MAKPDVSKIFGKIQYVEHFPDYKVQVVEHFADLHVEIVSHFPNQPGKWEIVEHFPNFKIQLVEHFPDFTVKFVKHFPGPQKNNVYATAMLFAVSAQWLTGHCSRPPSASAELRR